MPDSLIDHNLEDNISDRRESEIIIRERENIRTLIRYGIKEIDTEVFLYKYLFNELDEVEFTTPVYSEIYTMFKARVKVDEAFDATYFLENGSERVKNEVVNLITDKYEVSPKWYDKHKIFVPDEESLLKNKTYTDMVRLKFSKIKIPIQINLDALQNAVLEEDQIKYQKIHLKYKKLENEMADILGIVVSR
jgi:DNA primase